MEKTNDRVIRLELMNGEARVLFLETTAAVQRMADIHHATPVCTAALGRLMTGTLMLSVMLKGEKESVTVTVKGGGPMGTLCAVGSHGEIKAYADDPRVELPPRADGHLNVGAAVGHDGRMSVVKDLGLREPYVGQCDLVSGEMGIDFANYYTVSEQQPSLVSLGVLVSGDTVLKAGGLLIQPLPGCTEETLSQLELRSPMFEDLSREMTMDSMETLLEGWFRGMEPKVLEEAPVKWRCSCSRERMERALLSIGRRDLQEIIDDGKGAELGCQFCRSHYAFTTDELKALLTSAEAENEDAE